MPVFDLLTLGYAGAFLLSFALNMIPFAGPSNLFIASMAAINIPSANFLAIGLLVALGSATAKLIHFYVAFFTGRMLKETHRQRLSAYAKRIGKAGPLLLFLAAITSIPDEPIVVPLGLMKYNPAKFFAIFFGGKVIVATVGAYLGLYARLRLGDVIDAPLLVVISIVATIVMTLVLVKVDLNKYIEPVVRRIIGRP